MFIALVHTATIKVFRRDLAGKLGSPETQQTVPARHPGANAVEPVDLNTLGFRERFEFIRLGGKLTDIHKAHENLNRQKSGLNISVKDWNLKKKLLKKQKFKKLVPESYKKPASFYFKPLQKLKHQKCAAFGITTMPSLSEWQQKQCKTEAVLISKHNSRIKSQHLEHSYQYDKRKNEENEMKKTTSKKNQQFTVPRTKRPKEMIHRLKLKAASQTDCTGALRGELFFSFDFRPKYTRFIGFEKDKEGNRSQILRPRVKLDYNSSLVFGDPPELPPGYELGEGSRVLSPEKFERIRGGGWIKKNIKYTRFGNETMNRKGSMDQLHKLGPCFGPMVKLKRERMFLNWRRPEKQGAAAR